MICNLSVQIGILLVLLFAVVVLAVTLTRETEAHQEHLKNAVNEASENLKNAVNEALQSNSTNGNV